MFLFIKYTYVISCYIVLYCLLYYIRTPSTSGSTPGACATPCSSAPGRRSWAWRRRRRPCGRTGGRSCRLVTSYIMIY